MSYRIIFKTTGKGEFNKDEVVAKGLADVNAAQEAMKAAVKQYKKPGYSVTGSFQRGHAVNYVDGASPVLEGTLMMEVETGKKTPASKAKTPVETPAPAPAPEPKKRAPRKSIVHPDFQDDNDRAEEARLKAQEAEDEEEIEDVTDEEIADEPVVEKPKAGRKKKAVEEPAKPTPPRPMVQKDAPTPEEDTKVEPVLNWRDFNGGKRLIFSMFRLNVAKSAVGDAWVATLNGEVVRNGKGGTGFTSDRAAMSAAEAKLKFVAQTINSAFEEDSKERKNAKA